MAKARILLLEDDINLANVLAEHLEDHGFEIVMVHDGHAAMDAAYEVNFDLLLLDVKVPLQNGFDLLSHLREKGNTTPAIFLTSLGGIEDLSKGYNAGCDDYIKKPFDPRELILRIEAIIKRGFAGSKDNRIVIDRDLYFDLGQMALFKNGRIVHLQPKETALLKLFLAHPKELLTPSMIFEKVWGYGQEPSDGSLRTHIKNLRKAVGKEKIQTIKNMGYLFAHK